MVNTTDPVYPTLSAAIDSLNNQGVGDGGVTIMVQPGNPQTAPAGGYVINTTTAAADKPIIIDGNSNTITAPTPQASGSINDAIFKIIGTDWVTIQNCVMMENPANNTTVAGTNNMTEFGVALFYDTPTDGPQNCSIINNVITLGPGYQNAFGIYATSRTTATSMTTAADITDPNGAFHNLHIIGNTINGVNMGVVLVGSTTGNYMAKNIVINNNKITFGLTGTFSGYTSVSGSVNGILTNNVLNVTINNNQLTSDGTVISGTLRGIYHYASGTIPTDIKMTNYFNNNNIYLISAATTTASIYGIHLNNYNDSVTNYVIADTIRGLNSIDTLSSAVYGIYHQGTAKYEYIKKNIFRVNTMTTGSIYLINANNTVKPNGVQMLDSNRVDTLYKTRGGGTVYFYYSATSSDSTVKKYFTNNIIDNVSLTGASTFYGFYDTDGGYSSAAKKYFYNNIIQNITGGSNTAYGFYVTYSKVIDIHNNLIQQITNGADIYGIYAGSTNNNIYANNIFDLNTSSITGKVAGIYASGGTTNNIYNNFIYRLYADASSGSNQIQGINLSGGTTNNIFYNTIYLDAVSSGTDFGTSGIYASTGPTTIVLKNNIVVNNSTPAGTGFTVALRRAATSLTQYDNSSNNNLFYAGTPGASNLIYYDGTTPYETLNDFKTFVTPRETVSITGMPPFMEFSNTPYNLHINTTVSTGVESGGVAIAGINTDYDGDLRFGATGYAGTGTAPDMGADEFEGTPSYTCTTPNPGNTVASNTSACLGEVIVLSLENTIPGTGITYQWKESIDGISFTNISGATNPTYSFTMTTAKYYICEVTCHIGPETVSSTPVFIDFENKILSTTGDVLCGAGQATLEATGTAGTDIVWYNAPTGGSALYTGSPYTTPVITSTTNYYVAAESLFPASNTIGTGTSSTSYLPLYGYYDYSYSAMLYPANEVNLIGPITKISFNVNNEPSAYDTDNQIIYMGEVSYTTFSDNNLIDTTTLTRVKGPFSYTWDGSGWKEFTLTTPFNYSGNNSLLIVWINGDGSYASDYPTFNYSSKSNTGLYKYQDASFPDIPGTGTLTDARPNIMIEGQTVCSSPREEVVATVTEASPITITSDKSICNNAIDSIEVMTGASEYTDFTWTPTTNLYTDAACTTPYAGESTQKLYFRSNTGGTYTYICLAENPISGCATTDTVNITVLPAAASISAVPEEICISGNTTLSVTPDTGYGAATFQWASSSDGVSFTDITDANGLSYTTPDITESTYYKWTATASGNSCLTDTVFILVNNPQILSTTPGSNCGPGTVELSATANAGATINWYNAATGGQPIATGETYTTPFLNNTTSYYVEAMVGSNPSVILGDGASTSSGAQSPFYHLWGGKKSQYLIRASELTAAGFTAGNINSLSFEVASVGSVSFNDFNLSVGSTASTELTTTLLTGLQTVYTNAAYLPVVGENTINFVNPFMWDGTSNIVIEFCWSNNNSGSSANSAHVKYDNTSFNSTSYIQKDSQLASSLCALTTSATTGTTRPKFKLTQQACASPRVAVVATITEPPAITASVSPNDTICDGNEITLSVTSINPDYEYNWTYDTQTYVGASFTDSPSANTQYIVNAFDAIANCLNIDTINVVVFPSPSISVSAIPTSTICGQPVQLNATGVGYEPTIVVSENFNGTTHSFTAINNSTGGTPANAAWTLTPDGYSYGSYSPVVFHSNDNSQFIMSNSDAQGSGGTTNTELISPEFNTVGLDSLVLDFYHYFRSSGSAIVDVYDGTQWVTLKTYTSTVGSSSSFAHETINLSAYVGLSNVKIRFKYQSSYGYYWAIDNVTITGYTPQTVDWTSNPAGFTSNIANPIANPIINTTYIATVSNSYGCTDIDSIAITVNPITVSIDADQTQICVGSSANLTASGAEDYSWSDGTDTYTGANITVSPTATTTYSVTGTTALGCMNTAQMTITVNSYITKVDDVSICSGESYTWYGNVYSTAGTYYDTISATIGCDTAAQLNLTILPLPTITANASISAVCPGAPTVLSADGGVSYEWSTTEIGSSITVNPTTATTYTVTGTDANGCENTASVSINVNPLPNVSASATPSEMCIGESTIISASGAISYLWDTGDDTESFSITPDETTTYVVTGTDANGCENTAEITVIVNPLPQLMLTSDNMTICTGQSVTLTASSDIANTTYVWNNGLTDPVITQYPTTNTNYAVTATSPAGCQNTAEIDITVNPSPTVDLGEDIVQCGGTVILDAGAGFSSYQWNPPLSSNQTMEVAMSGTYSVTVTNEFDCSATDNILVTISDVTVSLLETESGLEATIDPIVTGDYTWYNCNDEVIAGVTEAIYTNPTIGECYYVVFTDEYNCEFISNQVTVTSIADNALSNVKVYPVPTTDKVTVELINNNGAEVYLYDMLGQLVNTYKMNDSKLTIDVSKLSGNFLLKVITPDNAVSNFRIVITK